jgi:hypothetical protein
MCEGPYLQLIFSYLKNGPNKVECYITIGRKGLPLANTPAYWAHS